MPSNGDEEALDAKIAPNSTCSKDNLLDNN